MKRRLTAGPGLIKDDRAQALVEFSFTIPIVLLFFFAILQYFEVVKASQLANYAAYAAARSFAVHASVDGEEAAKETATKAAALAMAPVARLVPGEVLGIGGDLTQLLPALPSNFPFDSLITNGLKLVQGYLVAKEIRFNSVRGGGSVNIKTNGSPKQVDVEINYPQPIYLPGLAELWVLVKGDKNIYSSTKSLHEGLGGIPEGLLRAREFAGAAGFPTFDTRIYPYVNVSAKCSVGFSDWGSKPTWRPRHTNDVSSAAAVDTSLAQKAQQQKDAACALNNAVVQECQACINLQTKHEAFINAPADQKDAAQQELFAARLAYNSARSNRESAQSNYEQLTGQDLGSPSSCDETAAPKDPATCKPKVDINCN